MRRASNWLAVLGSLTHLACPGCLEPKEADRALLRAAERGDADSVRRFLGDGGRPEFSVWTPEGSRGGSVRTLLGAAVSSGSWETVSLLTTDANNRDEALAEALIAHQPALAGHLIDAGAQVPPSWTDNIVFKILIQEDPARDSIDGLRRAGFKFRSKELQEVFTTLYLMNSAIRPWNPVEDPAFVAREKDLRASAGIMMSAGVPVAGHPTLIADAVAARDIAAAKELLQAGAAPDAPVKYGDRSALTSAVENGSAELVSALLRAGADPDRRDGRGETPRDVARRTERPDLERLLGAKR